MSATGLSRYLSQQQQEALGEVNKWYCSQWYGYEVRDPDMLISYYIKHGGASNFFECHCGELERINSRSSQQQ